IPGTVGKLLATIITLLAMSPFLWAITMRRTNSNILRTLWSDGRSNQVPIMLLIVFRYVVAMAFVIGFLLSVYSYVGMIIGVVIFILMMKTFSKDIQKQFRRLEKGFFDNLNQRERSKKGIDLIHDLHIARMTLHEESDLAGVRLADSNLRKKYGVNLVSILRGTRRINIPGGDVRLFPGDVLGVIGTEEQISKFLPAVECGEAVACDGTSEEVTYTYITINEQSAWIGKSTAELGLRNIYHCLLVGIERGIDTFLQPDGTIKIEANDILWVAGEQPSIKAIKEIAQGENK
ncbi:MAG: TrkA C-terminal domain-containing protein, partial [Bacteroidaceae bacterium]|nr:TrkA C-terminal domain-containing protein [Bacteroidaceae bacterium]